MAGSDPGSPEKAETGQRDPGLGFLDPPARPSPPRRAPPAGATDAHAHVFGPYDKYPLAADRAYTPAETPGRRYLDLLDQMGFSRGVLVQGGAHGVDCGAMLEALDLGEGRLRGVALAHASVADDVLCDMNARGVRALRFARSPLGFGAMPVGFEAFVALAPRIAALKWHAQVQTDIVHLASILDELLEFGMPIVVDHMGLASPDQRTDGRAWRKVVSEVERGRLWVKLTPYRMSRRFPDLSDMRFLHDAMIAANPERMLWGSDWPHVHRERDMPEFGRLIDLLMDWTPDEGVLRRILVDNPAELYGF